MLVWVGLGVISVIYCVCFAVNNHRVFVNGLFLLCLCRGLRSGFLQPFTLTAHCQPPTDSLVLNFCYV